ncbi:hypothetical protein HGRIS_005761 [Hohenbuehelia grisea]|uniref:Fungal N-terminal domain-containing protein n=1 Tax=Hohenbuehelia grisea TaxID=104357 RepID=A0ABR3JXS7_9AGAR
MDPLSITAAAVSFADIAIKLRNTLSKIEENNRKLQDLTSDVVNGLNDLHGFCASRRRVLDTDREEAQDLKVSLVTLRKQLLDAQNNCERLVPSSSNNPLGRAKSYAKAWLNRSDIEAELIRMKDKIHSCQMRFLCSTVARVEYSSLIQTYDRRDRMDNLENLFVDMMSENLSQHGASTNILDFSDPIKTDYLQLQLRLIIETFTQPHIRPMDPFHGSDCDLRRNVFRELKLYTFEGFLCGVSLYLRRVRRDPRWAYSWDSIRSLNHLGYYVNRFVCKPVSHSLLDCSLRTISEAFNAYDVPDGWDATEQWIVFDPADVDSKNAVLTEAVLRQACQRHWMSPLLLAIGFLDVSRVVDEADHALKLAEEALTLVQSVPDATSSEMVSWTQSTALSCANPTEPVRRSYWEAVSDALCLSDVARRLAACGQYAEARGMAFEILEMWMGIDNVRAGWFNEIQYTRLCLVSWHDVIRNPTPASASSGSAHIVEVLDSEVLSKYDSEVVLRGTMRNPFPAIPSYLPLPGQSSSSQVFECQPDPATALPYARRVAVGADAELVAQHTPFSSTAEAAILANSFPVPLQQDRFSW